MRRSTGATIIGVMIVVGCNSILGGSGTHELAPGGTGNSGGGVGGGASTGGTSGGIAGFGSGGTPSGGAGSSAGNGGHDNTLDTGGAQGNRGGTGNTGGTATGGTAMGGTATGGTATGGTATGGAATDGAHSSGGSGAGGAPSACTSGLTRSCAEDGHLGSCARGTELCDRLGNWGACSISKQIADGCSVAGDDSNCNGFPNEGCVCVGSVARSCADDGFLGNCAKGTETCGGGRWGACTIQKQSSDSCAVAGDDANCNGKPMEGCTCINGTTMSCGNCNMGKQTCANGAWGACQGQPALVTYFQDGDHDGYGNPNVTMTSCTGTPTGYVANNTDCCDTDAFAYPKPFIFDSYSFMTAPRKGCGGWDYNCDGVETEEFRVDTVTTTCGGWTTSVPSCGQMGMLGAPFDNGGGCYSCEETTITQACQ